MQINGSRAGDSDGSREPSPPMHVREIGAGPLAIVWAHGWGHSGATFAPVAEGLAGFSHYLLDLPGFGASPIPPEPWGTAEYADRVAAFLKTLPPKPVLWVGHSNGCRVGIRLAERHPGMLSGLLLIAAAGLPRPMSPLQRLRREARSRLYKTLRFLARDEATRDKLRGRFGSADYRNAGPMRPTLVRLVNENLADAAKTIRVPVQLVFGRNDTETPPALGERYRDLIPGAKLAILEGYDHNSILTAGRFQLQTMLKSFAADIERKAGA
ncbi:MAG: alpha/beta hydrolase [Bauldia sp.]|nr:alpha/beta hydrolase [Bauldia sp.]